MKITLASLMLLMGVLAISSCKKEKPEPPATPTTYPDYAKLKPGNYWIYQRFEVYPDGTEEALNEYDSVYVQKDTMIHGNNYHKYIKAGIDGPVAYYLRDSLSYIVNSYGGIIFSSEDFSTIFKSGFQTDGGDTIWQYVNQMQNINGQEVTPAGAFVTYDFCTTFYMHHPYDQPEKIRYYHHRYAKNIGLVSETVASWLGSGVHEDRRLVRYKVD